MHFIRTPDDRFIDLPDFAFQPHYCPVTDNLRMHYLDEGQADAPIILLLHGEPSWSFLYRFMIPPLVAAGYRCIAPDLIGFGRSDKPLIQSDYSYASHLRWLTDFIDAVIPNSSISLFCQDWGGLLGLRILANHLEKFANVIASNTFLPNGKMPPNPVFEQWKTFSQEIPEFPAGQVVQMGTASRLSPAVIAAYEAPFPNQSYTAGARVFPLLVPLQADDPEAINSQAAWKKLATYQRPFLTLFADNDPITLGAEKYFIKHIPGSKGQAHAIIEQSGHFIQEDQGPELARHMLAFYQRIGY